MILLESMGVDTDPKSLIISIISLVFTSLWTVIWAVHVRFRDGVQVRKLKLSEITNRYVKDGIQVPAKLRNAQPQAHPTAQQTLLLAAN